MIREQCSFGSSAKELAQVARDELCYHDERLAFWKGKKISVMDTIRTECLELDETNTAALEWHTLRRDGYDGWRQVLSAQMFFFGRG
ncbi:MAG: hypothetical protein Q7J47_04790 [Azoarcus sp.]|nr:hypothetical protein [Azoarcus sp.]